MRISSAAGLLLLTACGHDGPDQAVAAEAEAVIECAVAGATQFAPKCGVEQVTVEDTRFLTVRHPDGSFRRFELTKDGTGMVTADGAQRAEVALHEGGIEVAVGPDRYRFPATIADHDRR